MVSIKLGGIALNIYTQIFTKSHELKSSSRFINYFQYEVIQSLEETFLSESTANNQFHLEITNKCDPTQ